MPEPMGLRQPLVMIGVGLVVLWGFGYETVWKRLSIEVAGTITSSVSVPYKGAARYRTDYGILSPDGRPQTYTAGPTDASLQRGLKVGRKLIKRRWALGYRVDGTWIAFPTYFYFPILGGAVGLVGIGIYNAIVARGWRGGKSVPGGSV